MKTIKYKVWDKENNCWYEPTYEAYNGKLEDLTLTPAGELIMRTLDQPAIHESKFKDRFEVVWYTTRNDIYGKEIYAGDVIECQEGFKHWYIVDFCDGSFYGKAIKNKNTTGTSLWDTLLNKDTKYKIIGNKYEDKFKHLLK